MPRSRRSARAGAILDAQAKRPDAILDAQAKRPGATQAKHAGAIPGSSATRGADSAAVVLVAAGAGVIAFFALWIAMGVVFSLAPAVWVWYMQRVMMALMVIDAALGTSWQWNRLALAIVMSVPVLTAAALVGSVAVVWMTNAP